MLELSAPGGVDRVRVSVTGHAHHLLLGRLRLVEERPGAGKRDGKPFGSPGPDSFENGRRPPAEGQVLGVEVHCLHRSVALEDDQVSGGSV